MSFPKNILAVAIAGGLLSSAAQAQVVISAATPVPVRLATEVDIPAPGAVFTNVGNALSIQSTFNYNFSPGEVRFARVECTNTIEFETAAVALTGTGTVGAVNGIGTNAINFSVTAGVLPSLIDTNTLTVDGNRRVLAQGPVSCSYSLYDQPSQAASGGPAGLIVSTSGPYLTFLSSFVFESVIPNTSTSNVEAVPSFTGFVVPGNPTNNAGRAQLNRFTILPRFFVDAPQPIKANGLASSNLDLGPTTSLIIDGDFSAAANADGTFTGAALNRVFFSTLADCSVDIGFPTTALTATSATIPTGQNFGFSHFCYTPRAGALIPASTYALRWALVGTPGFTTSPVGPVAGGTIVRNGTELQAPLAQIPGGYISRLVLTNTGSVARTYTAQVLREAGNTGTVGSAVTGSIPANGTLVVNMADVLGTFTTGQPRGTVNVTIAGPNAQIQGLYQIVNPVSGAISNHVMVRPGTN